MSGKASNISDLIQRVASSCLTTPLPRVCHEAGDSSDDLLEEDDDYDRHNGYGEGREIINGRTHKDKEEEEDQEESFRIWEEEEKRDGASERVKEVEGLMVEVFEAVSAVKRAYVKMQEAHYPWDPERMRTADAAVVAELRRLGRLKERWWFRRGGKGREAAAAAEPYEAAVEELKRELRAKEAEVEGLKEKLRRTGEDDGCAGGGAGRRRSLRHRASRRKGTGHAEGIDASSTQELFQLGMHQVKEALKSFATHLLSLMRSAHWDIAEAVRSIEGPAADAFAAVELSQSHANHALESYISLKIFQGFENESFYIDGSLSSLLDPAKFRKDCCSQYHDMKAMDPTELLGLLPTCQFGKFCFKKFLAIMHPKMEESLFRNTEQRKLVLAGNHPRTEFYGVFLKLAKAVWLLHLLAFALDPAPSHFQANRGADFHPDYMESVLRYPGGRVPDGQVVGFPVTPGFKLGNGSIIKARVYLIPRENSFF